MGDYATSEGRIIAVTKQPNTAATIYHDLLELGVQNGDILLVHSSLSSLGWVCGGAQAVIMALRSAVGKDGTLVMPAHSGDWSDPADWLYPSVPPEWLPIIYDQMPAYHPDLTPTRGMGRIAELFRTLPDSFRSDHPQVSFAANGKDAAVLTADHPLAPQLGMESPLGKMYERNGKVLLLGVGYGSCTGFHLAESQIAEMPTKRMGAPVCEAGQRVWKWFVDFAYDDSDFMQLGEAFEQQGRVQKGRVGQAESGVFSLKAGVDFACRWLCENRFSH